MGFLLIWVLFVNIHVLVAKSRPKVKIWGIRSTVFCSSGEVATEKPTKFRSLTNGYFEGLIFARRRNLVAISCISFEYYLILV